MHLSLRYTHNLFLTPDYAYHHAKVLKVQPSVSLRSALVFNSYIVLTSSHLFLVLLFLQLPLGF